tara:strand:- start:1455 stop:2234 length:780 start_codon:yes stop_codon:yes gene_type:complete
MDFTNTNGIVTQSIIETCEHCDEVVRTIHISEIAVKAPNDPRTIRIKDKSDSLVFMKEKNERLAEITGSYIKKGLLDDVEAAEAKRDPKGMKYGLRAEAMCSESIDIDAGVTQSFCYRVEANPDNPKFQKVVGGRTLSASLARFEKTDTTGSRMGVDRKGNVIKMKNFKNLRMDREIGREEIEKDDRGTELIKRKGPQITDWFRALRSDDQKYLIQGAQRTERFLERYGEEVKTMKVVSRFRNRAEFVDAVNSLGGELR